MTDLAYNISTDLPSKTPVGTERDDRTESLTDEVSTDLPSENPVRTQDDNPMKNVVFQYSTDLPSRSPTRTQDDHRTSLAHETSTDLPSRNQADTQDDNRMSLAYEISTDAPPKSPIGHVLEMHRVPQITIHAFCETPELIGGFEKAIADRRMSRVTAKVRSGGITAAIDLYRQEGSPNLVVIEVCEAVADLYARLDALADVCVAGTKVIVVGYANDVATYRELLRRGVSEYIVAPVDPMSLIAGISRLYQDPTADKFGRSLAFIGANGGVGSSTIAQNVASTIARAYDCDVILADLDLPFGTASLGFDLNPGHGIAQAIKDGSRFDDVLLERLLTKCEDHLQILSAPATLQQSYDLEETALEHVLDVAQRNVPFVVLDVPHIWTSWAKKTLISAEEVVITATPDLASLRNAKSLVDLLKQARPNDAPPKVVLNQIGVPKRSEIKPDKFVAALGIEPIAYIPFDPSTVSTAANKGKMIADVAARSAVAKSFVKIAQAISGRRMNKQRKGRFAFTRLWSR
jgi:pilus assembly protein CpaE